MHKSQTFGRGTFLFLIAACGVFLTSCQEKISGVGSSYLHDTVSSGIRTFVDSSAFVCLPIVKHTAIAGTRNFNMNANATALLFGKVASEQIESWAAMKIPILPDSVGQLLADSLILKMKFAFHNGDPNDLKIDFTVYTEIGNKVNDSTTTLQMSDLSLPIASYSGTKGKDSLLSITIGLDTAILNPKLRTASLALVIVPNAGMNTIRGFASNENGDNTYAPQLKFRVKGATDTTTLYRNPTSDIHIVSTGNYTPPQGEFILRGSYASRERITVSIKNIKQQLALNPFVTINSALLQVRNDSKLHTYSNTPFDTTAPALAYIPNTSVGDSGHSFIEYGSHNTTDPDFYSFQIRGYVEHALRNGDDSLVVELRSGFAFRTFSGSSVDVEDYDINRWAFYGQDYGTTDADKAKRPKLAITYSYLR